MGSWARSFEAAVDKRKKAVETIFRRSVEMLGAEMIRTRANGGKLPHLTGNLMRSQLASTVAMPKVAPPGTIFTGSNLGAVAARLKIGQTVYIGYQANYARRQNYGFVGQDSLGRYYNQSGAGFAEAARAQWPTIVRAAAAEARLMRG